MEFLFKLLILISTGVLLLRISGRKAISQMTISQTVIMISIGSLIVQPIANKSIYRTVASAAVFILFLIVIEYLQLKFNLFENFISGKAKVVIDGGNLVPKNLKKMRMTVDQLEIRLRQQGITNISDVKTATIEANGQLGYELKREAKPLTIGEFEKVMSSVMKIQKNQPQSKMNIFDEVIMADKNLNNNNQLRQ